MTFKMNDTHSLSHTKWNCKYHKDQKQELYLKEGELGEQLTFKNIYLFMNINQRILRKRQTTYQPPLEAASSTGLRPLKKYPQLGWGMLIVYKKNHAIIAWFSDSLSGTTCVIKI